MIPLFAMILLEKRDDDVELCDDDSGDYDLFPLEICIYSPRYDDSLRITRLFPWNLELCDVSPGITIY